MIKTIYMPVLALSLCTSGLAASDDPNEIFARQGDQVFTQEEMDAAFSRIPEEHRLAFIRDGGRVDQLLQNLLRARQIAAAARAEGFDEQEIVAARMRLAAEKELAEAWMEHVLANAPEADFAALAEEYYLANRDEFMTEEMVDVSHILVSTENRSQDAALEIVEDLQDRLDEDPAQFDALVMEYSEDPGKATNQGRYPQMLRGQMVAPFEETAFSLEEPGQISEPVETTYGYHLIRLNREIPPQQVPFEQVKQRLEEQAKKDHLNRYRSRYIVGLNEDPIDIPEGAVEVMVKRHFGENLERAPDYYQQQPE